MDRMKALMKRLEKLPKYQQELIMEDLATALKNRIEIFEKINKNKSREAAFKMAYIKHV